MIGTLKFNPKFATFTLLESLSYCENWFFDGHVYIEKEVLSVIFFLVTWLFPLICITTMKINYLLDILIIFINIFNFK
jgi:hypothetical protein